MRWPVRVRCARCQGIMVNQISDLVWRRYHCDSCSMDFSVVSKTAFDKTKLNPTQLYRLMNMVKSRNLNKRPSELCKRVKVHHWTMTKLIHKVKGQHCIKLLNVPPLAAFDDAIRLFEVEEEYIPYALFLFTYKFLTRDFEWYPALTGIQKEAIPEILNRIRKCWVKDAEFEEEDINWYDWHRPYTKENVLKMALMLNLHALCLTGEIFRNPETKIYGIEKIMTEDTERLLEEVVNKGFDIAAEELEEHPDHDSDLPKIEPVAFGLKDNNIFVMTIPWTNDEEKISLLKEVGKSCFKKEMMQVVLLMDSAMKVYDQKPDMVTDKPLQYPPSQRIDCLILFYLNFMDPKERTLKVYPYKVVDKKIVRQPIFDYKDQMSHMDSLIMESVLLGFTAAAMVEEMRRGEYLELNDKTGREMLGKVIGRYPGVAINYNLA